MAIPNEIERLTKSHGWDSPLHGSDLEGLYTTSSIDIQSAYSVEQMDELNSGEGGWWYETRNQVIRAALRKFHGNGVLWDIGSGSGLVAKFLIENGIETIGIEPNSLGAQLAALKGVPSICGVLSDLKLPDDSLAGIGMFDVLEHLDDRTGMLREIHRVLMPDGHLYLTLPAFEILWSQFDVEENHQLRYSRRAIKRELRHAGFKIDFVRYFFFCPLPVILVLRTLPYWLGRRQLATKKRLIEGRGGSLGNLASKFELWWSKIGLVGSSVLVVARKS